jgi:glucosamine--fructose-6-phosphate aminotransferase (isomerizing)
VTAIEETHLYQEIHQQPQVLEKLLAEEKGAVQQLAVAIQEGDIDHVVIAARGTSDNAARYAKYLLGAVNGLTVALATPSLFTIYKQPPRFKRALALGVSQSGASPDIVGVLAEAHRQGALTAAITNFPDSDLARSAEHVIDLHAGQERSLAATKTYTSELGAIAMLSLALKGDGEMQAELDHLPQWVEETLKMEADVRQAAQRYRYMREGVVIGRGFNYATAYELALKLKELTYTLVEAYSSADFLHGPLALVEHGFPAIVVAPSGRMLNEMKGFISTLKEHQAEVVSISDDPQALEMGRIPLKLPVSVPEWLSPVVGIIPGQFLAMYLAYERDYTVDKPRSLRKVTETR